MMNIQEVLMMIPVKVMILLVITFVTDKCGGSRCQHREPKGMSYQDKVPGDNGFYISIGGQPAYYQPEATYTVSLSGDQDSDRKKQFTQFVLVAENSNSHRLMTDSGSAGTFQLLGDVKTKYSDHCTNTITETSKVPKDEIQVLWTAPPIGYGCIHFKAMVVEDSVWSLDDSRLLLTICEKKEEEEDINVINSHCCACQEAKYEVMFQGLWNKETHPKDFPTSEWLLHFSDLIGASHSGDYRVWEAGGMASKGLSQVAKWGSPRLLESELKAESRHIRTIIKARGLWHPNTNGKTFAIFRTDPKNHLVSLVSMLGPSPDWIVGISALELCMANCTWMDNKTMYLYPWDAGVDNGVSYESPDSPSSPAQPIKRITSQDPLHDSSPFYKRDGGAMKPLAKLTIQKLREYKKSCVGEEDVDVKFQDKLPDTVDLQIGCEMTDWSHWTGCSVTCGKGLSSRRRSYLDPLTADNIGCDHQMVQKEMCASDIPICQGESSFYSAAPSDWIADDTCSTTEWSDWSSCSVSCGKDKEGFRVRTRRFFNRAGRKKCPHVEIVMKETCKAKKEVCEAGDEDEIIPAECQVTVWSNWSPCSQSCGEGIKVRTRLYRVSREDQLAAGCSVRLMGKGTCSSGSVICGGNKDYSSTCSLPKNIGPCRGAFKRWYFDSKSNNCKEFFFGGCRGNQNNFMKYEDCMQVCDLGDQHKNSKSLKAFGNNKFDTSILLNDGFKDALDVLVKKRREDESDGMNESFIELEEQRQVVEKLEREKDSVERLGDEFQKNGELMTAQKKLMMMEKRMMMDKQMMMFKQKQMMMAKQKQMMMAKQKQMMEMQKKQMNGGHILSTVSTMSNISLSSEQNKDCKVTAWSPWSLQCSQSCGRNGFRNRFRTITQHASGPVGKSCPRKLERRKKCRLPPCQEQSDCQELSEWTSWGPCTHTCGADGIQERTRTLISSRSDHCTEVNNYPLVEKRVCLLSAC